MKEIIISKNTKKQLLLEEKEDTTLILEEGSAASITHILSPTKQMFTIIAKDKTTINLVHLAKDPLQEISLTEHITLGKGAEMNRQVIQLDGEDVSIESIIVLDGEGARLDDKELFLGQRRQKYVIHTVIHHRAEYTESKTLMKGLVKEQAYCEINGLVVIEKNAKNSVSHLGEHMLLLNKGAHAHAIPGMEIEAQDVQAGHSASVTKLDEQQIFYALARGIPEQNARKLIALGFLSPVLSPEVEELVAQKWVE